MIKQINLLLLQYYYIFRTKCTVFLSLSISPLHIEKLRNWLAWSLNSAKVESEPWLAPA